MERETVKAELKKFICAELMRNPDYPLGDGEPLVTGGLFDSFALAQIGVFIEKTFGVYIPDNDLTVDNMDSIDQMAECVKAAAEKESGAR